MLALSTLLIFMNSVTLFLENITKLNGPEALDAYTASALKVPADILAIVLLSILLITTLIYFGYSMIIGKRTTTSDLTNLIDRDSSLRTKLPKQ